LIYATIPAIILGFILKFYDVNYINLKLIGYTSIAGAILLYVSDKAKKFKLKIKNKSTKFIFCSDIACVFKHF